MKRSQRGRRSPKHKVKTTSKVDAGPDVSENSQPEVFVCYSREDRPFVTQLADRLNKLGRTAWVDLHDVKPTEEWRDAIYRGIEAASNFVFVISPHSITSDFCKDELSHAAHHHKRLIPLLRRPVTKNSLPEVLSPVQWIYLTEMDDFDRGLKSLISALDIDLDYLRSHSRTLGRALEWEKQKKNRSYLLRGGDLRDAEEWLAYAGTRSEQRPTSAQVDYILASRKAQNRTLRILILAGALVLLIVAVLMVLYRSQRNQARLQAQIALAHQLAAQSELIRAQGADLLPRSVLLAIESLKRYPSLEGDQALRHGLSLLSKQVSYKKLNGPLQSVLYSPDGKFLATTRGLVHNFDDKPSEPIGTTVWILDAASGNEVAQLHHQDNINALAYSPDGKFIATGGADKVARVWNSLTGKEIKSFEHDAGITLIQFSDDGGLLIAATDKHEAPRAWGVATWEEKRIGKETKYGFDVFDSNGVYLTTIAKHWRRAIIFDRRLLSKFKPSDQSESRIVDSVVLSADGKYLAGIWANYSPPESERYSEPVDYTIRILDTATNKETAHIKYDGPFSDIIFSPDHKYFLITGALNFVHSDLIYETDGAKEVMRLEPDGLISKSLFSADSKYITTVVQDGTVRIWNLVKRQEVCRIVCDGEAQSAALSPDGQFVATSSDRGVIQIWQAAGGQHRARVAGNWREAEISPDGTHLITVKDLEFHIWNFPDGNEIFKKSHDGLNFEFSPNRRYFATDYQNYKTHDYSIHVFETTTGTEIGSVSDPNNEKRGKFPWVESFTQRAVSQDGMYVVAEGAYGEQNPRPADLPVLVWNTRQRGIALRLPHPGYAGVAAFSPDGQYLASAGSTVVLWQIPSGRQLRQILPRQKVQEIVFSPSGKYLITASEDSSPQFWDTASGNELKELEQADSRSPVVFSSSERYLASAMKDGTGRIRDLLDGREVRLVHPGGVQPVAFSADGNYLGTSETPTSRDEPPATPHADIWESSSGREVTHFDEEFGQFKFFSPDGQYVVTESWVAAEGGKLWILSWKLNDLISEACARLTRNMTMDEWNLFMQDEPYRKTCPQLP